MQSLIFGIFQTAKYSMKTFDNPIIKQRLAIDEELFNRLQSLGLVKGLNDFSNLCGKNPSYFNCMKLRGYGIHIGSLAFLVERFSIMLNNEPDIRERLRLHEAITAVKSAVTKKCHLRELELNG